MMTESTPETETKTPAQGLSSAQAAERLKQYGPNAAMLLCFPDKIRMVIVPFLISYATGTLLGAAFLGMIPAGVNAPTG